MSKDGIIGIPRSPLAEAVAKSIEDRISARGLATGYRLGTKESLRREFDVAVATFNEAVRLLSARGTITIRAGVKGGLFVASPTALVRLGRKMLELSGESVSVADCLVVRDALEPVAVQEATRHRTSRDVRELRKIVRQMMVPGLSVAEYLRINWELHRRMVVIGPNEILRHTYLSLLEFVESRLQGVMPDESADGVGDGPQVHQELVEAIASGDAERAAYASRRHVALTANGRTAT